MGREGSSDPWVTLTDPSYMTDPSYLTDRWVTLTDPSYLTDRRVTLTDPSYLTDLWVTLTDPSYLTDPSHNRPVPSRAKGGLVGCQESDG